MDVVLIATLTCPHCGHATRETMRTDACVYFHPCSACGARMTPKPGDCCVFCSYADVKCPPKQQGEVCCNQSTGDLSFQTAKANRRRP